jgi:hypothetical protein
MYGRSYWKMNSNGAIHGNTIPLFVIVGYGDKNTKREHRRSAEHRRVSKPFKHLT